MKHEGIDTRLQDLEMQLGNISDSSDTDSEDVSDSERSSTSEEDFEELPQFNHHLKKQTLLLEKQTTLLETLVAAATIEHESRIEPCAVNEKKETAPEFQFSAVKIEKPVEVFGHEEVIDEIKSAINLPKTQPNYYPNLSAFVDRSILLFGCPGNGKTRIAKFIAWSLDLFLIHITSGRSGGTN